MQTVSNAGITSTLLLHMHLFEFQFEDSSQPHRMTVPIIIVVSWRDELSYHSPISSIIIIISIVDVKKFNSPNECAVVGGGRMADGEGVVAATTILCTRAHFAIILNSCSRLHECTRLVQDDELIAAPAGNSWMRDELVPYYFRPVPSFIVSSFALITYRAESEHERVSQLGGMASNSSVIIAHTWLVIIKRKIV